MGHHTRFGRTPGIEIYPPRHVRPMREMLYELHRVDENQRGERVFLDHGLEDGLQTLMQETVGGNMDDAGGEGRDYHMTREYHTKCLQTQVTGELGRRYLYSVQRKGDCCRARMGIRGMLSRGKGSYLHGLGWVLTKGERAKYKETGDKHHCALSLVHEVS